MLVALLYHRSGHGKYANPLEILDAHFRRIASRYPTVLPGDPLVGKLSVCLTFDDAFFDFYHHVFPLLKRYRLKALVAVPTAYIPEETSLPPSKRLEGGETFAATTVPRPSAVFCSWNELKALADSPLIRIASHSVHHRPLTSSRIDPETELFASKGLLEQRLGVAVNSFVYPFGLWNKKVHSVAKRYYRYIFRIGNAHNSSWNSGNRLLYRVNGDRLPRVDFPFDPFCRFKHAVRYRLNTVLGK
ncbi:MAG: polysaccharide deacetylase family protein [Chlamydiota bacterium]